MRVLIFFLKFLGSLIVVVLLYLAMVWLLPYFPVQAEATPEPKMVKGYIMTNGVHTDIVLPVKTEWVNWSDKFPYQNVRNPKSSFQYVALGWGDKGFYLDTPTWSELKVSTAVKAAFWMGAAALHVTYYEKVAEGENVRAFFMTERQYLDLIRYVEQTMYGSPDEEYKLIKTDAVYGDYDAFYEAKGTYSFLYTCNTWVNDALKRAGQKAALWTATDKGIFQHYPKS